MRLFIAAELPDELVDALAETSAMLRGCVRGRFVGPDLYHVTLAFLGDVPCALVCELAGMLHEACVMHAAFPTTLGALGTFGNMGDATLWQGFSAGRSAWDDLASHVRATLRDEGFSYDSKGFLPHVTLMRRADVSHGVLPMPCVERGTIRAVTLFSSDLSGDRPRYEALERVRLAP